MSFIIGISRYILPFLAVVILTKCMLSLLLGHPKEKTYGYIIDMFDGESYPLNMWETSIGRSNSCDIVVGYDTVSRFQAVISRRIDGWYVYDLFSKSGIKINKEKVYKKSTVKSGDVLDFGGMEFRFMVADDPVVRVGKKKKAKKNTADFTFRNSRSTEDDSRENFSGSYVDGVAYKNENPFEKRQENYKNSFDTFVKNGSNDFSFKESESVYDDFYTYSSSDDNYYYGNSNYEKKQREMPLDENYTVKKEQSVPTDADSIYSDKPTFTVETPGRETVKENFTYRGAKPAIFNKDTGEVFILCGNTVSIGRSRGNDIKLSSPSVSRHHADLVLYEDGWAIVDAVSAAGTTLNGEKISAPQLLFEGDVIGLSDERLYFTRNPSLYK